MLTHSNPWDSRSWFTHESGPWFNIPKGTITLNNDYKNPAPLSADLFNYFITYLDIPTVSLLARTCSAYYEYLQPKLEALRRLDDIAIYDAEAIFSRYCQVAHVDDESKTMSYKISYAVSFSEKRKNALYEYYGSLLRKLPAYYDFLGYTVILCVAHAPIDVFAELQEAFFENNKINDQELVNIYQFILPKNPIDFVNALPVLMRHMPKTEEGGLRCPNMHRSYQLFRLFVKNGFPRSFIVKTLHELLTLKHFSLDSIEFVIKELAQHYPDVFIIIDTTVLRGVLEDMTLDPKILLMLYKECCKFSINHFYFTDKLLPLFFWNKNFTKKDLSEVLNELKKMLNHLPCAKALERVVAEVIPHNCNRYKFLWKEYLACEPFSSDITKILNSTHWAVEFYLEFFKVLLNESGSVVYKKVLQKIIFESESLYLNMLTKAASACYLKTNPSLLERIAYYNNCEAADFFSTFYSEIRKFSTGFLSTFGLLLGWFLYAMHQQAILDAYSKGFHAGLHE